MYFIFGLILLIPFLTFFPVENMGVANRGWSRKRGRDHWVRFAFVFYLVAAVVTGVLLSYAAWKAGEIEDLSKNKIQALVMALEVPMPFTLIATFIFYSFRKGPFALTRAARFAFMFGIVIAVLISYSRYFYENNHSVKPVGYFKKTEQSLRPKAGKTSAVSSEQRPGRRNGWPEEKPDIKDADFPRPPVNRPMPPVPGSYPPPPPEFR